MSPVVHWLFWIVSRIHRRIGVPAKGAPLFFQPVYKFFMHNQLHLDMLQHLDCPRGGSDDQTLCHHLHSPVSIGRKVCTNCTNPVKWACGKNSVIYFFELILTAIVHIPYLSSYAFSGVHGQVKTEGRGGGGSHRAIACQRKPVPPKR
jgi:hypothetical protein